MARCLVTGACGGIGTHLSEYLLKAGHSVFKLDLKISSHHDIRYTANLNMAFDSFQPDWVFHLAALADIVPSIEEPYVYHRTNVDGTVNLLEHSRKYEVKKFIYAASSSCYGPEPVTPTYENYLIEPAYPYALTKWIGEQYVLHYEKVYGLNALSLRLFNCYGSGFRTSGAYGAVFGVFLSQIANGFPLTIVGDGEQKRDFVHVSDVCDAFLRAAESDLTGEIFNIGSGKPQSINRLAKLLGATQTINIPDRPGEPRVTHAKIKKAKELLDWEPQVSFEDGVRDMLKQVSTYKYAPLWTPEKIENATKTWFQHLGNGDSNA